MYNRTQQAQFPFAAIVGLEEAKRALMLVLVDCGLKGILISGGTGSGKSVLARSVQSLCEDQPFVVVPLNSTEDRLLGGTDLELTVRAGCRAFSRGILASADKGFLSVEDINLLDSNLEALISSALESEVVRVEREGFSATERARFTLIGTYDPAEGDVSDNLRDRVGLLIEIQARQPVENVADIISRRMSFDEDAQGFARMQAAEIIALRQKVESARMRLSSVTITAEAIRRIAESSVMMGVEGNRADLFAARAARANAALDGRNSVADEDIVSAIRFVLLPRATMFPSSQESVGETAESQMRDRAQADEHESAVEESPPSNNQSPAEELITRAIDSPSPVIDYKQAAVKIRPAASGRRAQAQDLARGRYIRATRKSSSRGKVAIDATLRAAAPFQQARRLNANEPVSQSRACVKIKPDELRFKRFKRRAGLLFVFVVDASGSMAANRISQAKGALSRLLHEAYRHRDKVALVSFSRTGAEVLLAPTRSVELAKRLVDALPAGGATPLAAGLVEAISLARISRLSGMSEAMLVVFTDGRANVSLRSMGSKTIISDKETIHDELKRIGEALSGEGISSLIVDTKSKFVSGGEAVALAELLGSRYVYLPRADADGLYKAISKGAESVRSKQLR